MSSFPLSIFDKQGVLELKPTLFSVLIYQSYIHNKKLVVFNAEFYNRELYVFIHFLHKLWNQLTTFAFSELPDVFVGTCIPYLFFLSKVGWSTLLFLFFYMFFPTLSFFISFTFCVTVCVGMVGGRKTDSSLFNNSKKLFHSPRTSYSLSARPYNENSARTITTNSGNTPVCARTYANYGHIVCIKRN